MNRLRRHIHILWVVAVLLMAGGQVLHAWQDDSCAREHACEERSDAGECPAGHACCNSHAHVTIAFSEFPQVFSLEAVSLVSQTLDESYSGGAIKRIDLPPQLS
jgi:hypothetical protein